MSRSFGITAQFLFVPPVAPCQKELLMLQELGWRQRWGATITIVVLFSEKRNLKIMLLTLNFEDPLAHKAVSRSQRLVESFENTYMHSMIVILLHFVIL